MCPPRLALAGRASTLPDSGHGLRRTAARIAGRRSCRSGPVYGCVALLAAPTRARANTGLVLHAARIDVLDSATIESSYLHPRIDLCRVFSAARSSAALPLGVKEIDYKDIAVYEEHRRMPKYFIPQHQGATAVVGRDQRARFLALLPFCDRH